MIAVFINKYKCLKKITSQLNNINIYIWRYSIMAHLGNTVINGALRVLGGEYVDTINGVTVGSSPKFTDTTYSSKTAASGGTDVSLVTTGEKYTWNNKSNLAIGTTASTAAAGNHTHTISIAADSGTNQLSMTSNTKYKITAGGASYIFTTPVDNNTTYSSKAAASGGTDVSLCTTGEKYTWNNKSNLSIGTTASTAAAGNHTHSLTIAADSGTSSLNMAANTTYKITAGGSTFIFKTPADGNTNNAVTQTATTTSANYEVLFSATADNTTRTEGARKNSNLTFNPSTGNLTVTKINGVATTISSAVNAAVGDTSCTISNSAITTTSMLEPFASNSSGNIVSITNMTASAGSVKIYFPALTEATSFKVRISN